jgi:hypothetical protein
LKAQEGETIYDYAWYPHMNSSGKLYNNWIELTTLDPATCVFVSSSRDHPTHLWDAFSGQVRCSYRTYNHTDEITAALSVTFNLTGDKYFLYIK